VEEQTALFPARLRRTLERGYNIRNKKLEVKVLGSPDDLAVRTHSRDHIIMPTYVGKTIAVYNGKEFIRINIIPEMIGHYFGEFALTRKSVKHTGPGVGATRSSKFMPLK
jgi:small subunit ribosomal protein S19